MKAPFAIRGVIPPLLTPLTEGGDALDEGALQAHVQWLIEKGVHGMMPCGSTGEGALLSNAERRRVVEVTVEAAAGRVLVLAHTGTATTADTVALARHAQSCGVDAVSVVTPYYFHLADAALVAHYCRVAEAVAPTPVFLYNIPQNTGNTLTAEVAEAIVARFPNVVGVKDSSGDLAALRAFLNVNRGRFQVVCGNDLLVLRALEEGACASVSGNANVFPEVVVGLFDAFWRGDREGARRRQEELDQVRRLLGKGDSLSLMKRALALRGLRGGSVRPPLLDASDEMLAELEESLRSLSLLR
jgi:4-hydroxy-tetrahydrodipicolinate synthase